MAFGFKRGWSSVSAESPLDSPSLIGVERTLGTELDAARRLLEDGVAQQVLPEGVTATGLVKEFFQSPTFQNAAYDAMPDRYGDSDRTLFIIDLEAGAQVFIAGGKISSGNPYEVGHAVGGGIDMRGSYSVAYVYDGKGTITEYTGGKTNTYQGEYGSPEVLLPYVRRSLGTPVGSETI